MKHIITFLIIILFFGCVTTEKLIIQQRYEAAFNRSLGKLKNNTADINDKTYLNIALGHIIQKDTLKAANLIINDTIQNGHKALKLYEGIANKIEDAKSFVLAEFIPLVDELWVKINQIDLVLYDHYNNLANKKWKIADSTTLKADYQEAYCEFKNVLKHTFNETLEKQIKENREYLLDKATVKINIEVSSTFNDYSWEINRKFDNLTSESGLFRQIYFENSISEVDCTLELDFDDIDIDVDDGFDDTETYSKKIITGYDTKTDTAGNEIEIPIYETITATATIKKIEKTITLEVDVDVDSHTQDCNYSSSSFSAKITTEKIIYEISGSEDAVPDDIRDKEGESEYEEDEDDLVKELINKLYNKVSRYYF